MKPCLQNENLFNWNHLRAQLYRNYKWAFKNIVIILFSLLWPLTSAIIATSITEGLDKLYLKVGYFNEELIGNNCSDTQVILAEDCPPSPLYSCLFVDIMKRKYQLVDFHCLEDGLDSVKQGNVMSFLYFPNNFSTSLSQVLSFRVLHLDAIEENHRLNIWMDNSLSHMAYFIMIDIYDSFQKMMEMKCEECGIDKRLTHSFRTATMIYGHKSEPLIGIYPSFDTSLMFYSSYIHTMALLLMEKYSGVWERLQMTGMNTGGILLGSLFIEVISMNIVNLSTMWWMHSVFQDSYRGSYFLVYLLKLLVQLLGSLLGILTLALTSTPYLVNIVAVFALLSLVGLNGSLWPSSGVHWLLRPFVDYNPLIVSGFSYENIAIRNFTLSHHLVYFGFIYIIVANVVAASLIYFKIRSSNYKL